MWKTKFGAFVVVIAAAAVPYYFATKNFEDPRSRDPAAINKAYDFSTMKGASLYEALKQRVISGVEYSRSSENIQLAVGHFIFADANGIKKSACDEYKKVVFVFEADGYSSGDQLPTMEVEGFCEASNADPMKINPITLPVSQIISQKAGDGSFQFSGAGASEVRFANLPEEWPKVWMIKSVSLKSDSENALSVSREEVTKYLGRPFVIQLK